MPAENVIQISFPKKQMDVVQKYHEYCEEFGVNLGQVLIRSFVHDYEEFLEKIKEHSMYEDIRPRPGRTPYFVFRFVPDNYPHSPPE